MRQKYLAAYSNIQKIVHVSYYFTCPTFIPLWFYVLSILMANLLSYLPNYLQRSSTIITGILHYCLLEVRVLWHFPLVFKDILVCYIGLSAFWHSIPCRISIGFSYKLYLETAKLVNCIVLSFSTPSLYPLHCKLHFLSS